MPADLHKAGEIRIGHRIRTVKYRLKLEKEADKAIELFALNPVAKTWEDLPAGVWRVLLERHAQLTNVVLANDMAENPVTLLPEGLPSSAKLSGLMLLLLHSMKLPFPPEDRSQLEAPPEAPPASLKLH